MKVKTIICGAVIAVFAPSLALAAEVTKGRPSWAGWYSGAYGGYAQGPPASGVFNPMTYGYEITGLRSVEALLSGPEISLSVNPSGPLGGLNLGHNWQSGALVLGWEADVSGGKIKKPTIRHLQW